MGQDDEVKPKPPRAHVPRLLVPGAKRRGSDPSGYTDIPALSMRDEPEALSHDDFERHVLGRAVSAAEQRAALALARLEAERRLMTFDERLRSAVAEARRRRVDVSSDVFVLGRMRAAGKAVRHLEARLGVLERKAFRELQDP